MSGDREAFMRMMGISEDDVADPKVSGQRTAPGGSACPGAGTQPAAARAGAGMTMKRRAFLAEMGLDEAGMPLATTASPGVPPLAPPSSSTPSGAMFSAGVPRSTGVPSSLGGIGGVSSAEELKAAGNTAFEGGNYLEAIKLYTQAIETGKAVRADATFMAALYSNRSASYLQGAKLLPSVDAAYDHALCDADEAVALRPNWFKGYSRQGDAYFKSLHYHQAVEAYAMALHLQPGNANLANSLRESRERAKSDSHEQWQARRQARKQQHSLNGSESFRHGSSSSVASSSFAEPASNASLGYEGTGSPTTTTTTASSLNNTGTFGGVQKPSFARAAGNGKSARELWSELKSEVEGTAQEQVTGDDYRRQQLERFRQQREAKAKRLFGAGSADSRTKLDGSCVATGESTGAASAMESPKVAYKGSGDKDESGSASYNRRGSEGSTTSGARVGSQVIPDEYSSSAASAYQQRLLEQFRQRKMKA